MTDTVAVSDWVGVDPADMTFEQLSEARKAVQAATNATQEQLNWMNLANMRLSAEVSARFDVQVPGLPPVSQMPPYPTNQVSGWDWPVAE